MVNSFNINSNTICNTINGIECGSCNDIRSERSGSYYNEIKDGMKLEAVEEGFGSICNFSRNIDSKSDSNINDGIKSCKNKNSDIINNIKSLKNNNSDISNGVNSGIA